MIHLRHKEGITDLSDVKLAEALDDRASFRRFCGFAAHKPTPERTAFVRFRREVLARDLDRVLFAAWGAATQVQPKFVSPSDPAAQWTGALGGPAFFADADNYLIDLQSAVIVDVEASRAVRQAEVGAARTMVDRTAERFGLRPAWLAGDSGWWRSVRSRLTSR